MNKVVKMAIHQHPNCFFFFLNLYLFYYLMHMHVFVWAHTPVHLNAFRGQRKAADPLELELQQLSALDIWLEPHLDPLEAVSSLHCCIIS